jgi:hypothetical protein
MTDPSASLPTALRRALQLLIDPPSAPDATRGYLDLTGAQSIGDDVSPSNTGWVQKLWASRIGAMVYDKLQAASRRLFADLDQRTTDVYSLWRKCHAPEKLSQKGSRPLTLSVPSRSTRHGRTDPMSRDTRCAATTYRLVPTTSRSNSLKPAGFSCKCTDSAGPRTVRRPLPRGRRQRTSPGPVRVQSASPESGEKPPIRHSDVLGVQNSFWVAAQRVSWSSQGAANIMSRR